MSDAYFGAPNDFRGYQHMDYIQHFGILGMKWGVRRYQNPDGSLTAEGQKRYRQNADGTFTKRTKSEIKRREEYEEYLKKETAKEEERIKKVLSQTEIDNNHKVHYEDDNTKGVDPVNFQHFVENNYDIKTQIAKNLSKDAGTLEFWDESVENAFKNLNLNNEDKMDFFARVVGQKTSDLYVNNDGSVDWELDDGDLYGGHHLLVALDKDLQHIKYIDF